MKLTSGVDALTIFPALLLPRFAPSISCRASIVRLPLNGVITAPWAQCFLSAYGAELYTFYIFLYSILCPLILDGHCANVETIYLFCSSAWLVPFNCITNFVS